LAFQDLIVCGIREEATRIPAMKPIISELNMLRIISQLYKNYLYLYHWRP
jgi:hypothetical protein